MSNVDDGYWISRLMRETRLAWGNARRACRDPIAQWSVGLVRRIARANGAGATGLVLRGEDLKSD